MLLPALLAASTLLSPGSAPVWQDFDAAPAAEAAPAQRIWRIACLGDSITAGATLAHPRRLGFPEQLSARLNAEVQWVIFIILCIPRQYFGFLRSRTPFKKYLYSPGAPKKNYTP